MREGISVAYILKTSKAMTEPQAIEQIIRNLTADEKKNLLEELRKEIPIHHLEQDWNISAEFVLEAISRSQDITKRGVRGIVAELCFSHYIIEPFLNQPGWSGVTLTESLSYDSLVQHEHGRKIRIQVKNQRVEKGIPLLATKQAKKKFAGYAGWWIAECQRTRNGTDTDGKKTRPYKFDEFDILAVCLHPSTNDWSKFMFIDARNLIPRATDNALIDIMQPVAPTRQGHWYESLKDCIDSMPH